MLPYLHNRSRRHSYHTTPILSRSLSKAEPISPDDQVLFNPNSPEARLRNFEMPLEEVTLPLLFPLRRLVMVTSWPAHVVKSIVGIVKPT